MSEPLPGESRPEFRPSRRGDDRAEVERFVTDALDRIAALKRERDALDAQLATIGVTGAADLQEEIESVGSEVRLILHAAREAADSMRSRAAEDVERWRADAEAEAADTRDTAQMDSEQLRAAAWATGTELLEQSATEADAMRAAAKHDTLLIRAEAEQEAHRLVASARRDIQEEARASRLTTERTLAEAKAEAEKLIESARFEAEAAQERAGALEHRRGELMQELEDARAAIAGLESDLEMRPESLRLGDDDSAAAGEPGSGAGAVTEEGEWLGGDTSVRIVPMRQPRIEEEVDADAMAAEVERLRTAATAPVPEPPPKPEPEPEPAAEVVPELEPEPIPEAEVIVTPDPEPVPDRAGLEVAAVPDATDPLPATPAPLPEPPLEAAPFEPEPDAPEPESDDAVDEQVAAAAAEDPVLPAAAAVVAPAPVLTVVADVPDDQVEPDPPPSRPLDDLFDRLRSGPAESTGNGAAPPPTETAAPSAAPTPPAAAEPSGDEPAELRDRLLMPLTNQALRTVKRVILDLQNEALDGLRTNEWTPDPVTYEERFADDLVSLAAAARHAGAEAAGRLAGDVPAPQLAEAGTDVAPFGAVLADAVQDAIAGSGTARQPSPAAPVSRVFRGWRSDEAERRVRSAAYLAYHGGLVDGLAALGVERVAVVASGIPCAECPAGRGASWDPAGPVPPGAVLPPARPSCVCTVAPSA